MGFCVGGITWHVRGVVWEGHRGDVGGEGVVWEGPCGN